MVGLGTLLNVVAIVAGSAVGVWFGAKLPERTTRTVTDALALVVLVIGALNVAALLDVDFSGAVGGGGTLLIVLFALLAGGILGSLVGVEERLEAVGGWLQRRLVREHDGSGEGASRARFIEGFVDASLLFCIGPLAVLGSLSDGLGHGIDQLVLKSVLDAFAAMAFASTLGWGVAASALPVLVYQGGLTLLALLLGSLMPPALVASMTATGGVLLLGVGLRLLGVKQVPVADMLPAIVFAPVLTLLVSAIVG